MNFLKSIVGWKRTLVLNVLLVALIIFIGFIHTEIILKDKITSVEDEAISEMYGRFVAGISLALWFVRSSFFKKTVTKKE